MPMLQFLKKFCYCYLIELDPVGLYILKCLWSSNLFTWLPCFQCSGDLLPVSCANRMLVLLHITTQFLLSLFFQHLSCNHFNIFLDTSFYVAKCSTLQGYHFYNLILYPIIHASQYFMVMLGSSGCYAIKSYCFGLSLKQKDLDHENLVLLCV